MNNKIIPALLILLFSSTIFAASAAFDCKKASTQTEKTICANEDLQEDDDKLNRLYKQLFSLSSDNQKTELKKQQQQWLVDRNKISDEGFLKTLYEARIQELKKSTNTTLANSAFKNISISTKYEPELFLADLRSCDHYLCNAYKAYFLFPTNPNRAYEFLLKATHEESQLTKKRQVEKSNTLEEIKKKYKNQSDIAELLIYSGSDTNFSTPFIILKNSPRILYLINGSYSSNNESVSNLVDKLDATLPKMPQLEKLNNNLEELEVGHWYDPAYSSTTMNELYLHYQNEQRVMLLAPTSGTIPIEKSLEPLEIWSNLGVWNKTKYKEFAQQFNQAADELARYYNAKPELQSNAPRAKQILAEYINSRFSKPDPLGNEPAYKLFTNNQLKLDQLKVETKNFNQKDLNLALKLAVLNDFTQPVLEWLITSGAQINSGTESALMYGLQSPNMIKFLLSKGAQVNYQNAFGKTALFYAVQFNRMDIVKLLVAAKADINHQLLNLDQMKNLSDDYKLYKTGKFTPLIYSVCYASPEITHYLLSHNANSSLLSIKNYFDWLTNDQSFGPKCPRYAQNKTGFTEQTVQNMLSNQTISTKS